MIRWRASYPWIIGYNSSGATLTATASIDNVPVGVAPSLGRGPFGGHAFTAVDTESWTYDAVSNGYFNLIATLSRSAR